MRREVYFDEFWANLDGISESTKIQYDGDLKAEKQNCIWLSTLLVPKIDVVI